MAADGPTVVKTYDRLRQGYGNHHDRWERMAPFLSPSRLGITGAQAPGEIQTKGVYDSTSMMACELFAHFIAGNVINPGQRWMSLRMRNLPVEIDPDPINEWLDELRDLTLGRSASSSFYAEGAESLVDWAGFGTGCLFGEENPVLEHKTQRGFRGFYFEAQKTGRFIIDEGPDGLVDTLYREFSMSAGKIVKRWPNGNIPERVRNAIAAGKTEEQFKIIHGVYPRPKAEQASYRANGLPFASCWVEHETKTLIHESGYRVFPAAIPRYHRTPGEVVGRGRGDLAFPDTWSLNAAKRLGLEDHALKIRPPILHGHAQW